MKLTPKEQDRLTIFTLAELARRRRARGLRLNYPEAVALLCDEVMEEARAGMTYEDVVLHGMSVLTEEEVMEGVAKLAESIFVEAVFDDGTKLVVLSHPIRSCQAEALAVPEKALEGWDESEAEMITLNAGKPTITLVVTNTSDHPVHVTSHMPFWKINTRMHFEREQTRGYRLDIPAGGSVRWEPGETKEVRLCLLK